jgi:hypothetical protein
MIASTEFLSTLASVKVVVTAATPAVLMMLPARDGAKGILW